MNDVVTPAAEDDNALLTTTEAAEYAGLTPAGFRRSVTDSEFLRQHRVMIDKRTPAYPRWAIRQWRENQPGRGGPGQPRKRSAGTG